MFYSLGSSLQGVRPKSSRVKLIKETTMLTGHKMNMACMKYENMGSILKCKIISMSKMTLIVKGPNIHYRSNSEHTT
jgi:hypothetical protein